MNTARRITSNFLSLAISEIISKVLQLVIFIYLARALGKDDFGVFSFGFAFAFLIVIIADFGLITLLIREISRNKKAASKYLSNALIIKLLLSVATVISSYLFLNIMHYSLEVKTIAYVMVLFALIQSFTNLYYSIFRAFEKMYYDAIIKVLRMLMLVGVVFYAINNKLGLFAASLAFPATELVMLLVTSLIVYNRFIKVNFEFDYRFSKKLLKDSSLFCLSLVFSSLFLYVDTIMLSKIKSITDAGIYSAAANIMLALIFIPLMYGNAIYPVISRFYINSKKSLRFAYEKSFKYMALIGFPISAGIYVLSRKIILFLYGREYIASAAVLAILSGYLFIIFLTVVSGFTLSSINRQGSRVIGQGIAAFISIILNLIFIPPYGVIGAAIATVITQIIFFLIYIFFIVKYGLKIKFAGLLIRPAIASAVMVVALQFIGNLFAAVIFGALSYCITLIILRAVDLEDKRILNKIIKNA